MVTLVGCGSAGTTSGTRVHPVPVTPSGSFTSTPVSCAGVSVFPSPGARTASPTTQISFRNAPPGDLTAATVTVRGSVTGVHQGRFVADSDGLGASLYPTHPFAAGETVTVTTPLPICGASTDSSQFQVALPPPKTGGSGSSSSSTTPTPQSEVQHFRSAPHLKPPVVKVGSADPSPEGDFFLAPKGGTLAGGPMIIDGRGRLVWFDPLPLTVNSSDFRVQTFAGKPVLTWWQGQVVSGHGVGEDVIMSERYRVLAVVKAGNGYAADLHEFLLGPNQTAWITAFNTVGWNLSGVGGPSDGAVLDGIVQEVDVRTGNVLFEWHSLDHVPPSRSYSSYGGPSAGAFDYLHVNSIDPSGYGTVLISARNTDAVYLVNQLTGAVVWQLGGKGSSFRMGRGTRFALQHDARLRGSSVVTIFDDEDDHNGGPPARAIALHLDLKRRTASLLWAYQGPGNLAVNAQGNVQVLADGNLVVSWGSGSNTPTTEMTPSGSVLFRASLPGAYNNYRSYRSPWSGRPPTTPSLVAHRDGNGLQAYVSWNGATGVASWRVLTGSSRTKMAPVGTRRRTGFQTGIHLDSQPRYLSVEALSASGAVLASSPEVRVG